MAAMNSSVLACNYAISGAGSPELNAKLASLPSVASSVVAGRKFPVIRAQQARVSEPKESRGSEGRRAALLCLTAALFTTAAAAASNSSANAGVIEEYLEKSKANKVYFAAFFCHELLLVILVNLGNIMLLLLLLLLILLILAV